MTAAVAFLIGVCVGGAVIGGYYRDQLSQVRSDFKQFGGFYAPRFYRSETPADRGAIKPDATESYKDMLEKTL